MRAYQLFLAISAAGLAVLLGCDGPSEPSSEQQVLAENRERFRTSVGGSYSYDYRNVCFCVLEATRPVRIRVHDQVRVSVATLAEGSPIPRERWSEFLTVEEIFDTIRQALDQGAASVRVTYDASLGYPRDVFIDFDERIADEERAFTLDNLVVTP